ncbi:MAG: glycosyltransferase family 2 protein [Flavobacterium sp.]|nr:glycosyltransferase family 2 protein [Flavobacterium sp.]
MNKKSLDFLEPMFPFSHFSNFSILIVNQTQKDSLLTSDYPNIKIINSFEKGLSRSRNLALQNATKKLCLIADDDIVYAPDFEKEIVNAFNTLEDASLITFNHQRVGVDKPQKIATEIHKHTLKSIWNVSSIEIAFSLDAIKNNSIVFNDYFGLGSVFETAEEFLFLRSSLLQNLKLYYYPSVIVSHPKLSSGIHEGQDKLLFARTALFYKTKGKLAYLWLIKYLFFLLKNDYIKKEECIQKFKIGIAGIRKYKELEKK